MIDTDASPRRSQRAEAPTKGDRREHDLLDAAERLLADGTFGETSVAGIAQEAGLSRASFYFYFASKQALLATLLDNAVRKFNQQIINVVDGSEFDSPTNAVRATVRAASELWWEHGVVLKASVELGTSMPEVYDRTMQNFAIVGAPTVELLRRHGSVPEASDERSASSLVTALMLMSERNYFDLMRGTPTLEERDSLTSTLQTIWLRSFGLAD